MFSTSTQRKNWMFPDEAAVNAKRQKTHNEYVELFIAYEKSQNLQVKVISVNPTKYFMRVRNPLLHEFQPLSDSIVRGKHAKGRICLFP